MSQEAVALIRQALAKSREPDPHVIARRVLPRLTAAQRDELLLHGLEELTRAQARAARDIRVTGPTRWQIAERVCVGGAWRLLDDCGAGDLHALADEYRERAQDMAAKEREYRALAGEVEKSGCATVGEMRQRAGRKAAA